MHSTGWSQSGYAKEPFSGNWIWSRDNNWSFEPYVFGEMKKRLTGKLCMVNLFHKRRGYFAPATDWYPVSPIWLVNRQYRNTGDDKMYQYNILMEYAPRKHSVHVPCTFSRHMNVFSQVKYAGNERVATYGRIHLTNRKKRLNNTKPNWLEVNS